MRDCGKPGVIYLATHRASGKKYVGQTVQRLAARIWVHFRRSNEPFGRALRKYGREEFDFIVLESCPTADDLRTREIHWIAHHDCRTPNGYNVTSGGEGGSGHRVSETVKKRFSETRRGEGNPNFGNHKPWTEERRMAAKVRGSHFNDPEFKKILAATRAAARAVRNWGLKGEANPSKRPDVRVKISQGQMGKKKPREQVEKHRQWLREYYTDPVRREQLRQRGLRGAKTLAETAK